MTSPARPDLADPKSERGRLWSLLIGNLVIGTGILLPAGMLTYIAHDFGVPVAQAGWLMTVSGLTVGIGAPIFALLAGSIDRRVLLIGSLLLYAAGHLLSVLAPNFTTLLIIRAVMSIAAGIFTPQAAAAVGLLVPGERRASGIAFIFLGWSLASVAGIPLGSLIASYFGWRTAFLVLVPLALLATALIYLEIPKRLPGSAQSLAAWSKVLTSPPMLLLLLATTVSMTGQFTVLTYLQPVLRDWFGAGPAAIAILLTIYGIAGIAGNAIASSLVVRTGLDRTVHALFAAILGGFIVIGFSAGSLLVFGLGVAAWGIGSFGSNSLQQARLVARNPDMASASVALNTSAVYVGQAFGSFAGGTIVAAGSSVALGLVAAMFLACALAASIAADRMGTAA